MLVVLILSGREFMLRPDGRVHIRFLDVGQGDSTLITLADGKRIIIDGGPDWSTLEGIGRTMPFFNRSIDVLVLSHPNADHMTSFPEILRRYSVKVLVTAGTTYDSGIYAATLARAKNRGTQHIVMHAGQVLNVGEDTLEALWPPAVMPVGFDKDVNNESLTLRFTHAGKRALFTGDFEEIVEKTLVAASVDLKADILKVPHHGSKTSSSTGFLLAVHPSTAIISVARENSYGHPNPGVLSRLRGIGADVRLTDDEGDIEIVW